MKPILSVGVLILLTACAEPVSNQHASQNSREVLRRKSVRSPYIATSGSRDTWLSYPRQGEYRNYGPVDVPPIASGPAAKPSAPPSDVTPTGSHRRVINQITNEPVQ